MEFKISTNPKIDSFNNSKTPMVHDAYQPFDSDVTNPHQNLHESLTCKDDMMNNPGCKDDVMSNSGFNQTFTTFDTLENLNCYQV